MHLGYFVSPTKSTVVPTQRMVHLGFGIDSKTSTYFLTEKKRTKFRGLRDQLMSSKVATLKDIQRFVGKCNHLRLLFPASSLFTIRCRRLESSLLETPSPLPPAVVDEIAFWTFVDSCTDPIPFRLQQHLTLRLFTDASGYGWGAQADLPSGRVVFRDYWTTKLLGNDICVKEALAVLFALQSISTFLQSRRIDVFVDNEGLVKAWSGLSSKSIELSDVLQSLFLFCVDFNISLKMTWVSTHENPADAPSRALHRSDSLLAERLRKRLWSCYGPFSFDLLALPSNVFRDPSGGALPFFSPSPVRSSAGVNVFAQSAPSGMLYAFPPFAIITPLINLFIEWGSVSVVVVLPSFPGRRPTWLALLSPYILDLCTLSSASDVDVLGLPSPLGYNGNCLPLGFGLSAYRCRFPSRPSPPTPLPLPPVRVFAFSGSMLRPFVGLHWPSPFVVVVESMSGARLRAVIECALRRLSSSSSGVLLFHAGVNDALRIVQGFERGFRESCDFAARAFRGPLHGFRVVCSLACQTKVADINQRVAVANLLLREFADQEGWVVISNDNIHYSDLADDVHLNASGVAKIFRNILQALRSL